MYTIGEFSKITGLTVKTLRFYHEQSVLDPTHIDAETGYRYYGENKVETARVIAELRRLDFSVADIAGMLNHYDDDGDILAHLERHKQAISAKVQRFREISKSLETIITKEREAREIMQHTQFDVEEKTVQPQLVAGVRMKGKYSDCGKGFAKIGKRFGFRICGKPMMLIYDSEYKENDADFEPCMPIRKGVSKDEIQVRELPGGRSVSLLHQGPYDELKRSYEKIFAYIKQKGYKIQSPSREVYIKGPGMIFKGNPKKYLTEIQMFVEQSM